LQLVTLRRENEQLQLRGSREELEADRAGAWAAGSQMKTLKDENKALAEDNARMAKVRPNKAHSNQCGWGGPPPRGLRQRSLVAFVVGVVRSKLCSASCAACGLLTPLLLPPH
jgi:hypothetical protein